jgi:hypothetical protein
VGDDALKAKSEKADLTDFDLDMPEPQSARAEEEKRRQSAAMFWENWLVASQDDRLQSNSGREVGENRTPPKAPRKGPS